MLTKLLRTAIFQNVIPLQKVANTAKNQKVFLVLRGNGFDA